MEEDMSRWGCREEHIPAWVEFQKLRWRGLRMRRSQASAPQHRSQASAPQHRPISPTLQPACLPYVTQCLMHDPVPHAGLAAVGNAWTYGPPLPAGPSRFACIHATPCPMAGGPVSTWLMWLRGLLHAPLDKVSYSRSHAPHSSPCDVVCEFLPPACPMLAPVSCSQSRSRTQATKPPSPEPTTSRQT